MQVRCSRQMRTRPFTTALLLLVLSLGGGLALAQETGDTAVLDEPPLYSAETLDVLVGPIALYPDELLGIVLAASSYPLQIVQAARFLEAQADDETLQPDPDWDDSVVALLNYPEVLQQLNADLDWTWQLGDAVLSQQAEVLAAVERFRERAYAAGNLTSDERQLVTRSDEAIEITPSDPTVIYVPDYEPAEVLVYQPRTVLRYYPEPCPVYYYPYPVGYRFSRGHFWGVTSVFSLGFGFGHLRVNYFGSLSHPYYGQSYAHHFYRGRLHDHYDYPPFGVQWTHRGHRALHHGQRHDGAYRDRRDYPVDEVARGRERERPAPGPGHSSGGRTHDDRARAQPTRRDAADLAYVRGANRSPGATARRPNPAERLMLAPASSRQARDQQQSAQAGDSSTNQRQQASQIRTRPAPVPATTAPQRSVSKARAAERRQSDLSLVRGAQRSSPAPARNTARQTLRVPRAENSARSGSTAAPIRAQQSSRVTVAARRDAPKPAPAARQASSESRSASRASPRRSETRGPSRSGNATRRVRRY